MPPLSHPLWQQQPDLRKWQGSVPTPTAGIHSTGTMATVGVHLLRIWLISRKPKCYPTEISINQLQCWKGPVFTIKVLQKNTALKIWWDQGLVEILCRAATSDWDRSSRYMSHLTTFINLPLSLFQPISSTYAMVSITVVPLGFFWPFNPFNLLPPQQEIAPQHKSRPCPGALQKSCQLLPDGSQTLAVSTIGRIKFHLKVRTISKVQKILPTKNYVPEETQNRPRAIFWKRPFDNTWKVFPTNKTAMWHEIHFTSETLPLCHAVPWERWRPIPKTNRQIFHQPTFWPKKRTTEALGHHLNWLLPWNMFFRVVWNGPKKHLLQNPTTDLWPSRYLPSRKCNRYLRTSTTCMFLWHMRKRPKCP